MKNNKAMGKESSNIVTCNVYAMFVFLSMEDSTDTCNRCKLVRLREEKANNWKASQATEIPGTPILDTFKFVYQIYLPPILWFRQVSIVNMKNMMNC